MCLGSHSYYGYRFWCELVQVWRSYGYMKIVIFGQFCSSSSSSSKVVQRDYLKNHAEPQQNKHTILVVVAISRSVSTLCSKRRFYILTSQDHFFLRGSLAQSAIFTLTDMRSIYSKLCPLVTAPFLDGSRDVWSRSNQLFSSYIDDHYRAPCFYWAVTLQLLSFLERR